jgi:hypothetical protein
MLGLCPDMVTNDFSGVYHGYAVEKRWFMVVTTIGKKNEKFHILITIGKHGELLQ